MNNEDTGEPDTRDSEGGNSRADADYSLRLLISCSQSIPSQSLFSDEEEWLSVQSESVVHWAELEGYLITFEEFKNATLNLRRIEGGQEHQVLFNEKEGVVLKVTKPPYFGHQIELGRYAQNALWSNMLFGDSIRFEWVIQTPEGASIVISQPFVRGRKPTDVQVKQWFEAQAYTQEHPNQWKGPNGERVYDTHRGNFVRTEDGYLIPIDLQINHPGHSILQITGAI